MKAKLTSRSVKDPREFFDYLKTISVHEMQYEFEKLLAIEQWAKNQLPIKDDDQVVIHDFEETDLASGWWPYREALHEGATATVKRVIFNSFYHVWQAEILLDKEWSVTDWGGDLRRYYREGDKRGIFSFSLKHLRKINV